MIRFTTRNSKYEVTVQKNQFHIKKFEDIGYLIESAGLSVGQTTVSDYLTLGLGTSAYFGGVTTSRVVAIEEV